jgi:hypothetical protein
MAGQPIPGQVVIGVAIREYPIVQWLLEQLLFPFTHDQWI